MGQIATRLSNKYIKTIFFPFITNFLFQNVVVVVVVKYAYLSSNAV